MHACIPPLALLFLHGAAALPLAPRVQVSSVTTVTPAQLSALAPYTQFARAAYCPPSIVQGWACGRMSLVPRKQIRLTPSQRLARLSRASRSLSPVVMATPSNSVTSIPSPPCPFLTIPLQTMSVIGPPPTLSSSPTRALIPPNCNSFFPLLDYIRLPSHSLSDLTDVNIVMKNLDSTLFPGVDSSIQVHSGFADEHAKTARTILNQVESLISHYGAASVTLVCISLSLSLPRPV